MSVEDKLQELFPNEQWTIDKTTVGESDQTFIATSGEKKVFIKYDITSPALKRLGELGVSPKIIYDGTQEERPYIIQEFVDGKHPDRKWFADNLHALANFIRVYQHDTKLKDILLRGTGESYAEHIEHELHVLQSSIDACKIAIFADEDVTAGIRHLQEKSKFLRPVPLVPTHADPNSKNFLVTKSGLMMVDWGDILVSDPMKDVGLMLWWYVPKSTWNSFFEFYGQQPDEEKIFWWTARASIQIATWFGKRNDKANAEFFIRDFLDALDGKENSQMYLNEPV